MNKIIQRIPNYFTGFSPEEAIFNSWEELYSQKWIKRYENFDLGKFERFSVAGRNEDPEYQSDNPFQLMTEFDGGTKWWCVGFMKEDIPELPTWHHVKKKETTESAA